jgi:hypothetical protein
MKPTRARATAWIVLFAVPAGTSLVALAAACGASETASSPYDPDATVDRATISVHADSECGKCVTMQCAGERRGCAAEPACATYLACADACPSAPSGDIDPACEAACARPTDPAGLAALDAFTACRTRGAGTSCTTCGPASVRYRSPILQQDCKLPAVVPSTPVTVCPPSTEAIVLACRRCQYEKCCDTRTACDNSATCLELRSCTAPCAVKNRDCYAKYDDSILGVVGENLACVRVLCTEECSGGAVNPCATCVYGKCGDENVALYGSAKGLLLDDCELDCSADAGCLEKCLDATPTLKQARADYRLCVAKNCLEVCGRP